MIRFDVAFKFFYKEVKLILTYEDLKMLRSNANFLDVGDKVISEQIFDAIERRIEQGFFGFVATTKFRSNLLKFLNSARIAAQVYGNDEIILFGLQENHVENALAYISGHCKDFSADDFHIDFTKEQELHESRKIREFISNKSARRKRLTNSIKQIYNRHKSDVAAKKILLAAFAIAGISKRETLQNFSSLKPSTLSKFFRSININFSDNPVDESFTEQEILAAEKFAAKVIKEKYPAEIPRDDALEVCYNLSKPIKRPIQYISESTAALWLNESLQELNERREFCGLKTFTFPNKDKTFYDFYEIEESVHIAIDEARGKFPILTAGEYDKARAIFDFFEVPKDDVIIVDDPNVKEKILSRIVRL